MMKIGQNLSMPDFQVNVYSLTKDAKFGSSYPFQIKVVTPDYVSDTEYINAIHFWDATILEQWRSNYTGVIFDKLFADQKYFTYRPDYEVWRRQNFNDDGIPLSSSSANNDGELDDFEDDIPF